MLQRVRDGKPSHPSLIADRPTKPLVDLCLSVVSVSLGMVRLFSTFYFPFFEPPSPYTTYCETINYPSNLLPITILLKVLAGSGDVDALRILRELRWKAEDGTYGSHLAVSMATGFLFLAGKNFRRGIREGLGLNC